ncbi:hypothetical protein LguiA_008289 [Lonicera macranthoides]
MGPCYFYASANQVRRSCQHSREEYNKFGLIQLPLCLDEWATCLWLMAQLVSSDETQSLGVELLDIGRSLRSSFHICTSKDDVDEESVLQWAAIDRLPTFERLRSSLFDENNGGDGADTKGKRVIDALNLWIMKICINCVKGTMNTRSLERSVGAQAFSRKRKANNSPSLKACEAIKEVYMGAMLRTPFGAMFEAIYEDKIIPDHVGMIDQVGKKIISAYSKKHDGF